MNMRLEIRQTSTSTDSVTTVQETTVQEAPTSSVSTTVVGTQSSAVSLDGSTSTITTTTGAQASIQPTTVSNGGSSKPEINGSEGGFIAVVVVLCVIFVGSCAGIFFLLRNRPHGGRRKGAKSGRVGEESHNSGDTTSGLGIPRQKRGGTLFGYRSRKKNGWVRAAEGDAEAVNERSRLGQMERRTDLGGDEWDSDVEEWDMARTTSPQPGNIVARGISESSTMYNDPYAPHHARHESSMSTVNLVAPGGGPMDYGLKTSSPPLFDADHNDNTGNHPPSSFRYQIATHDLTEGETGGQQHERNISIDSAKTVVSPTAWPGGTKFKEGL